MTAVLSGSTIDSEQEAIKVSLDQFFKDTLSFTTEFYTGTGEESEPLLKLVFDFCNEKEAKVVPLGGGICRITKKGAPEQQEAGGAPGEDDSDEE
ncbi:unnamed protein product [Amoebophrya sp. A120]|nr:unnamed protein product [Amoebophrya sp. A120]|eukprot:GSA120T00019574001.1